jgi:hypothetical protein
MFRKDVGLTRDAPTPWKNARKMNQNWFLSDQGILSPATKKKRHRTQIWRPNISQPSIILVSQPENRRQGRRCTSLESQFSESVFRSFALVFIRQDFAELQNSAAILALSIAFLTVRHKPKPFARTAFRARLQGAGEGLNFLQTQGLTQTLKKPGLIYVL